MYPLILPVLQVLSLLHESHLQCENTLDTSVALRHRTAFDGGIFVSAVMDLISVSQIRGLEEGSNINSPVPVSRYNSQFTISSYFR